MHYNTNAYFVKSCNKLKLNCSKLNIQKKNFIFDLLYNIYSESNHNSTNLKPKYMACATPILHFVSKIQEAFEFRYAAIKNNFIH